MWNLLKNDKFSCQPPVILSQNSVKHHNLWSDHHNLTRNTQNTTFCSFWFLPTNNSLGVLRCLQSLGILFFCPENAAFLPYLNNRKSWFVCYFFNKFYRKPRCFLNIFKMCYFVVKNRFAYQILRFLQYLSTELFEVDTKIVFFIQFRSKKSKNDTFVKISKNVQTLKFWMLISGLAFASLIFQGIDFARIIPFFRGVTLM